MDTLRVGLIGAGANCRERHIPGFQALPGVDVVAVVNRSPASGAAVAREFGIPRVLESAAALLADPAIDAVCIGTWPYKHREYTLAALAAGKHVLCEARMAMNAVEAAEMLAAVAAHPDLVVQIVPAPFDLRLGPTVQRLLAEGALGELREAHVRWLNGAGLDRTAPLHWRHRRDLSGNNTMMLGIYHEIVQRWLGEARRLSAQARTFIDARHDPESGRDIRIEIPDSLTVAADFASGVRVSYQFSCVAAGRTADEIVLYGSEATLHWSRGQPRWHHGDRARWARHGEAFRELAPDPGSDRGWRVEEDFLRSIREGAPVRLTNARDGVRYMRFTDAVWRSWQEGRAVEIEPLPD